MTKNFKQFSKHLKVCHPRYGQVKFEYHPYLERLADTIDNNQFVIFKKFRHGGFTTFNIAYALWQAISKSDYRTAIMCRTDMEARRCMKIVQEFYACLPTTKKYSIRMKHGSNSQTCFANGSSIMSLTPFMACGKNFDHLYMDEPAFWDNAEAMWSAIYPCVACGGKAIVGSTPNGTGNWFHQMYENAVAGKNSFAIFKADYTECPFWDKWRVDNFIKSTGLKAYSQELLAEFV